MTRAFDFIRSALGVKVTNMKKALAIGKNIIIGKNFVFQLPDKVHAPRVYPRWGKGKLLIRGAEVERQKFLDVSLTSVSATKDLYNTGETAYILVADPVNKGKTIELVVKLNGNVMSNVPIKLRKSGLALHAIEGLPEGEYTAHVNEAETGFMVAQYKLVPFSARYAKRSFEKDVFKFRVILESFGVRFEGGIRVELMQQRKKAQSKESMAREGILECEFELPKGDEPLTINFVSGDKSASLPIRGGKEKEREEIVINPLGHVIACSMMPISHKKERGLFFKYKETNNEPFLVQEAVASLARISARRKVLRGMIVVINPLTKETSYIEIKSKDIEIPVPKPYGICLIGAVLDDDGKPSLYEGYTIFVHPNELELDVKFPKAVKPGDEVVLKINTTGAGDETEVLVVVQDARITVSNTLETGFAAAMKKGITEYKKHHAMVEKPELSLWNITNEPGVVLGNLRGVSDPRFFHSFHSYRSMIMDSSIGRSLESPSLDTMMFAASAEPVVKMVREIEEIEMGSIEVGEIGAGDVYGKETAIEFTSVEPARVKSPETLLCRLVTIKDGEAQVAFRASQNMTKFTIHAQALSGLDWAVVEKQFEVAKDPYGEFVVPPYVYKDDVVYGKLVVGCGNGAFTASIIHDGKPVTMLLEGKEITPGQIIQKIGATIEFPLSPGKYEAIVTDEEGNSDISKVEVAEPGRFRHIVKTIKMLLADDAVSVEDYPDTIGIAVLPGIEKDFRVLTRATADYSHLCCEQTACKIASAIAMFCFSGGNGSGSGSNNGSSDDMRKAESIILAGIEREKSMWEKGRGFRMYPDSNSISEHYSELAARYLLSSLGAFKGFPKITPALKKACHEGFEMAWDVVNAHKIAYPPKEPASCRDAYEIWLDYSSGQAKQKALNFVRNHLEAVDGQLRVADRHMVESRAETAFAAAVLFISASAKDIIDGIKAANWVCSQFGPEGRLYSTIDSIAAVGMMQSMFKAGVVKSGSGCVIVDGKELSLEEAIQARNIRTIEVKEGVAAVQITYMKEEDWAEYQGKVPVSVALKRKDEIAPDFRVGEEVDLIVRLKDGYKPGDIAHICLPDCLSAVLFGAQLKNIALDFEGKNELIVPLAVTGSTIDKQTGKSASQHFAVCVRNMFEEERAGNPGIIGIAVG